MSATNPTLLSLMYITAPDMAVAESIGAMLVQRRLAACVNLLDKMKSMYWWQGEVQRADEVVLIAKTRTERVPDLVAAVKEAHPYDCPCVVSMPLADGNPDFLAWIEAETD